MIYTCRDWGKETQTPLAESRIEGRHFWRQAIQRTTALEILRASEMWTEQCGSGGRSLTQWLQRLREGSCRSRRRGRSSGALSSRTIPISILALAAKDRCCCEPLLCLSVELGFWNPDVTALFARTFFGIEFYGSDCHSARPEILATCGWNKTLLSLRFLLGTVKSARTAPVVWKGPEVCRVRHAAIK